jgi:beta-galactosidase
LPEGVNIFDLQAKRPSAWPYFEAGCGDIDITGEKKPQMLYRDVLWDNSKLEINVHAPIPEGYAENVSGWGWPDEWPSWTWEGSEGDSLEVRAFTKGNRVRLELNGELVGEKEVSAETQYIASFVVPFEPGELKAIAYEEGEEIATKSLKTAGDPASIRLIADRDEINTDRNDLSFVKIEIVDESGQVVPRDSIKIKLTLTGNGELAASGNASPYDMESFNRLEINTFKGRAQAIIRPFAKNGNIKLIAEADDLKAGDVLIKCQSFK